MELLGYLALVLVGLVLGLIGGGGSMLAVPILVYLFSLDVVVATGYALLVVGTTSVAGSIIRKQRLALAKSALWFALPSVTIMYCTRRWIVPLIPDLIVDSGTFQLTRQNLLLSLLGLLIVITSALIAFTTDKPKESKHQPVKLMASGAATGLITGLLGIGGGFLILPSLVLFGKIPFKMATGTALVVIALNSFLGLLADAGNYTFDWTFGLSISMVAIAGITVGTYSQKHLSQKTLHRSFSWVMTAVGCLVIAKELFS